MFYIIDRRRNPKNKSLGNNQRFKNRARDAIKSFVDESVNETDSIKELGDSASVRIKSSRVHEPSFYLDHSKGDYIYILPGNTKNEHEPVAWIENDHLPKPQSGKSRGKGGAGSDGDGEDEFEFALTEDEKYEILLEDLELPNQRETVKDVKAFNRTKAGYTSSGSPSNFALKKTMRNSIGRRLSLDRPHLEEVEALEAQLLLESDSDLRKHLLRAIDELKSRMIAIPYIDKMDVKYYNIVKLPKPIFRAVMFCIMDVSGSMTEQMKDLAKRFYILLYRFLKQKYREVEIIFIRHHHTARTVLEKDFFYAKDSGGTIVSTALDEMLLHFANKYDSQTWNIYVAQASDGDNTHQDNPIVDTTLRTKILPHCQYYAYLEIGHIYSDDGYGGSYERKSDLWDMYHEIHKSFPEKFVMKKANRRSDIFPVFREMFQKRVS